MIIVNIKSGPNYAVDKAKIYSESHPVKNFGIFSIHHTIQMKFSEQSEFLPFALPFNLIG
jgi:hypothetical protein